MIDGESIEHGSIRFLPRDGRGIVVGGRIQQGAYRIEMEPGSKRVEIRSSQFVGERVLLPRWSFGPRNAGDDSCCLQPRKQLASRRDVGQLES